jgi:hypothetical protein
MLAAPTTFLITAMGIFLLMNEFVPISKLYHPMLYGYRQIVKDNTELLTYREKNKKETKNTLEREF